MAVTTVRVVDFYRNNNNGIQNNGSNSLTNLTNTLGFSVTGGYSSDIPATIFNINTELHDKLLKVIIF